MSKIDVLNNIKNTENFKESNKNPTVIYFNKNNANCNFLTEYEKDDLLKGVDEINNKLKYGSTKIIAKVVTKKILYFAAAFAIGFITCYILKE